MARDQYKCSCGAPAIIVFETEKFGPVGWCGRTNVGEDHQDAVLGVPERSEVRWAIESPEPL